MAYHVDMPTQDGHDMRSACWRAAGGNVLQYRSNVEAMRAQQYESRKEREWRQRDPNWEEKESRACKAWLEGIRIEHARQDRAFSEWCAGGCVGPNPRG